MGPAASRPPTHPASTRRSGVAGDAAIPAAVEQGFERRALLPRLAVLLILLLGASISFGHESRLGHGVILIIYGATTVLVAAARAESHRARARIAVVSTIIDAALTAYVVADHLPRGPDDAHATAGAVGLLAAFLFLLQTAFRLRAELVALFAAVAGAGWLAALLAGPWRGVASGAAPTPAALQEALNLAAFLVAAAFVHHGLGMMRRSVAAALREREDRLVISRFLPEGIALDVVRGGDTAALKDRHACLLGVDLRGSSALAREFPSASVLAWLLEFRALVHDAVAEQGGIVDKYVGDGVLALFLQGSEDEQAERAFEAVRTVLDGLERWNGRRAHAGDPPLRVIASLNGGRVLAGVLDDGRRAEFTVLGPAANELSRIERRAKVADVDAAIAADVARRLPPLALDGMIVSALSAPAGGAEGPDLVTLVRTPSDPRLAGLAPPARRPRDPAP